MRRSFAVLIASFSLLAGRPGSVEAAQPGFYVGGSWLENSFDARQEEFDAVTQGLYDLFGFTLNDYASTLDDSDSGYEFLAGYRLFEWLAFEAGYLDFGQVTQRANAAVDFEGEPLTIDSTLDTALSGIALSALGIWQATDRFSLYLRGGFLLSDSETRVRLTDGVDSFRDGVSDGNEGFLWGIGAGLEFADIYTLRFEYRQVLDIGDEITGKIDAEALSLGLIVAFGF
jgi:opacity protein-like surface antigen